MSWPGPQDPEAPLPAGDPDERRPETLYDILHPWTLLFLALGCILLYQVITAVLWSAGHLRWGLIVAPVLGTVAPLVTIVRHLGLSPRRELQLHLPSGRDLGLVVWVLVSALPVTYALSAINIHFVPMQPDNFDLYQELIPRDALTFVVGLLGVVILAPLAEELIFRGLILNVFVRSMSVPLALILSGALFGASHAAPWMFLPITFLGVVIGIIMRLTGSLAAAWLGHGLFNLAAYVELAVTQDATSSRIEDWCARPSVCAVSLVLLGAGLVLLARRRRAQDGE